MAREGDGMPRYRWKRGNYRV
ncbi:uncharacterized protein FRV6_02857 [Fusarium oxysporum]|uniref:Uncharacterized protein n=1 Tax=Fusarium oxysporum TaxID=5507 RepID=A0A2H3T1V4_FUSOX|nr:uncharacterized protein FRV6_02857 [Fusarium oxysporum]